ncbi:hypothetical protein DPMN_043072 [Dreissena polymorpha]|uniref:Uncharacterized protein n=1 Tax=Dreissena polymorpha TaxID=45954 RepID=A0A9D4D093_DREPO|nr:hypothetical protein DPMN_043072 [Dreissena polymorpha]
MMAKQGIEDRARSHLQPSRGITMADRVISNIVPVAQHTCGHRQNTIEYKWS